MGVFSLRSIYSQPSTTFTFQVVSDLHLEVNQQYSSFELPATAPYLLLPGDIGCLADYDQYLAFLQEQDTKFQTIFLVLGNHEFYKESLQSGLEKARQLEQEPSLNGRLILLHKRRYDVPDTHITILGCTLWSRVPEESKDIGHYKIQDYQKIQNWTVDTHNEAHESDLNWLRDEVQAIHEENKSKPPRERRSVLVVTHHAPSLRKTSSPQHERNAWSVAFGTDLLSRSWEGVKMWVFGHTHYSTEFRVKGIRVVSNQRGYVLPWTTEGKGFDAGKAVSV